MRRLLLLPLVLWVLACVDDAPVAPDTDLAVPTLDARKAPPPAAYFPGTGNYYDAVAAPGIPWDAAFAAVAGAKHQSCTGHLATITSQEENDFIATTFPGAAGGGYWLGGGQEPEFGEPDRGWGWVTGEPFVYANWNAGEPNDAWPPCDPDDPEAYCNEDRIQFAGGSAWNDEWNGNYNGAIGGYVVEYDCGPTGPVVARVSGHGTQVSTYDGTLRTFSFNARRYADGRVEGQFELFNRGSPVKVHGRVVCFTIEDNRVWLGALLGHPYIAPYNEGGWIVLDNGEGAGSPPDRMSGLWTGAGPGFASAWCTATPMYGEPLWAQPRPIDGGNIQIQTP